MPPRTLASGTLVAERYKIAERLGGGGMGDVYRAEHELAGRVVAFKLLREDFAHDQDLVRRFFQEAQAVNRIRHPNIVDVLDAGFCELGPYVVMECLEGTSVHGALARLGRFDATTALAVVMPMLDALDAAHGHGIVHRDLKPENVFVAKVAGEGHVKLLDFGIAKVTDTTDARTHTGVIFGTPDYLAPEQASGEGVVDGRSDLFSVAIVLFELLTGRRPFSAGTAMATAYRIVHERAPTLREYGVDADARLQFALDTALEKVKERRYATPSSFADALAPIVAEGPVRREALRRLLERVEAAAPPRAVQARVPDADPKAAPPPAIDAVPVSEEPSASKLGVAPTLASAPFATPTPKGDASSAPALRERVADRAPLLAYTPRPIDRLSPTPTPVSPIVAPAATPTGQRRLGRVPADTGARRRMEAWADRPLPLHARGKHARGTLLRAALAWLERSFGKDATSALLDLLPPSHAESFRTDAFNSLVWYDLDALDALLEAAAATLMFGSSVGWHRLAREHFERDLGAILRPTARVADPVTLLERSAAGWSRVFDFGTQHVRAGAKGRAQLRFEGFDATSLAMRHVVAGTIEGLVASSGAQGASVRFSAGETSFARDLGLEVSWRA
jgi:serine/threonine-protein kinase